MSITSKSTQRFSGTDLSTNHLNDPGVVFPLAEADQKPNFAGIMEHRGHLGANMNHIAHYEYRIADGKIGPNPENTIHYTRGRCHCYTRADATPAVPEVPATLPSSVEAMFGFTVGIPGKPAVPAKNNSYSTFNEFPLAHQAINFFKELHEIWDNCEFTQDTTFVNPDNVARKTYAQPHTFCSSTATKNTGFKKREPIVDYSQQDEFGWGLDDYRMISVDEPEENELIYIQKIEKIQFLTTPELSAIDASKLRILLLELSNLYYDYDETLDDFEANTLTQMITEYEQLTRLLNSEVSSFRRNYPNVKTETKSESKDAKDLNSMPSRAELIAELKTFKIQDVHLEKATYDMLTKWKQELTK